MKRHLLTGSCLCKRVKYSVAAELQQFFLCHCEQCRKVTGSAFASNIQAAPAEVKWLAGAEYVKRFDYPGDRLFTKVFCSDCGCHFSTKPARSCLFRRGHSILSQGFFLDTISSGEIDPLGMKPESPHQEARDSWNNLSNSEDMIWLASNVCLATYNLEVADEHWQPTMSAFILLFRSGR